MYTVYITSAIPLCTCATLYVCHYGVATTSRLLKIIGFFCKRAL